MSRAKKFFSWVLGCAATLAMICCALYCFGVFNIDETRDVNAEPDAFGGQITGRLINGVLEGYGEIVYSNGDSFNGNLLNGKFHGEGAFISADGWSYAGNFDQGLPHGKGVLTDEKGGIFNGFFENGKISGLGTFQSAS